MAIIVITSISILACYISLSLAGRTHTEIQVLTLTDKDTRFKYYYPNIPKVFIKANETNSANISKYIFSRRIIFLHHSGIYDYCIYYTTNHYLFYQWDFIMVFCTT
ncbi:MAG: hypothetical protein ACFFFH_18280 [Candidatus Thorarchaeota archaeon]